MNQYLRLTLILAVFSFSFSANAGLFEVGVSGTYRTNTLGENKSTTKSVRGSLSYYFWELSAIEASYTNGRAEQFTDTYDAVTSFEIVGLDFVLTLADKKASFRPYVKLGGVYLLRSIAYKQVGFSQRNFKSEGLAPSAGLGLRLLLSKHFALKFGVDGWTSPLEEDDRTYDYAGRAGISWLF